MIENIRSTNLRFNLEKDTREREERFVNQIISSVESAMERTLPVFLAGCMAGLSQASHNTTSVVQQEPDAELDWDFLGE